MKKSSVVFVFQVCTYNCIIGPIRELVKIENGNSIGVDGHHVCDDAENIQHKANLNNNFIYSTCHQN